MCYTCNPTCDNCMPKMLECPTCGHIELLGREACTSCGEPITDDMRADAEAQWKAGRKYGQPSGTPRKNLVLERLKREAEETEKVSVSEKDNKPIHS